MKTVVITGVSRGIGKALAEKFLANGDFVVGTSTTGNSPLTNQNLTLFQLDLSNPESIDTCTKNIIALNRKIDILINNAAFWAGPEESPAIRIPTLRKVLEVDLIGVIDFTERLLHLVNQDGHIVNVSSRQGSLSFAHHANSSDYKIAKAGLNMFTRVLSFRLQGKATVSSVHPGAVKTDMGSASADMEPAEAAEHIFKLATSQVETGQFWFKGEKFPW